VANVAFATEALRGGKATALYVLPTKALARDQLRQVRTLRLPQVRAAVYDGDTPKAERPLIRRTANLVAPIPAPVNGLPPAPGSRVTGFSMLGRGLPRHLLSEVKAARRAALTTDLERSLAF